MPNAPVAAAAEGLPENLMKSVREARGWSQTRMAAYLDIGQNTVSRIEAGTHRIDGPLRMVLDQMADENRRLASAERMVKFANCDADRIEQLVLNFIVHEDIVELREAASLRAPRLRAVLAKASAFGHMTAEDRSEPIATALAISIADDLRAMETPILGENVMPPINGRADREIAEAYCEWLLQEHSRISLQLYPNVGGCYGLTPCNTLASSFHFPSGAKWTDVPPPSTRAATVLQHVGIDLSDAGKIPSAAEYDAERRAVA